MSGEPSVELLHQRFSEELDEKIEEAYLNAPAQERQEGKSNTTEILRVAAETKEKYSKYRDEDIIRLTDSSSPDSGPGEVYVENPHDYVFLVDKAATYLISEGDQPESLRDQITGAVNHELEHAVRGIDEEGLKIYYGIVFFKNKKSGRMGIRPAIQLTGQISYGTYKKILSAPSMLSDSDMVQLGLRQDL